MNFMSYPDTVSLNSKHFFPSIFPWKHHSLPPVLQHRVSVIVLLMLCCFYLWALVITVLLLRGDVESSASLSPSSWLTAYGSMFVKRAIFSPLVTSSLCMVTNFPIFCKVCSWSKNILKYMWINNSLTFLSAIFLLTMTFRKANPSNYVLEKKLYTNVYRRL